MDAIMTKGDRDALLSLAKKREKVMRASASERSAAMLADFDAQLAKIWSWDDDEVWSQAKAAAQTEVLAANEKIAARCKELGIPDEFAPRLAFGWMGQNEQAVAQRRQVLRQAAKSRIAAVEKDALTKIERMSLQAQTELLGKSLTTEAARAFLDGLKPIEELMPALDVKEVEQLIEARTHGRRGTGPVGYLQ